MESKSTEDGSAVAEAPPGACPVCKTQLAIRFRIGESATARPESQDDATAALPAGKVAAP